MQTGIEKSYVWNSYTCVKTVIRHIYLFIVGFVSVRALTAPLCWKDPINFSDRDVIPK